LSSLLSKRQAVSIRRSLIVGESDGESPHVTAVSATVTGIPKTAAESCAVEDRTDY
jgi:hypothetical protein